MVVFPEPVPPDTTTFSLPSTQARSKFAISGVKVLKPIRSFTVKGSLANFRMVIDGPFNANGGMMALTREPSGKRASTIGELSSMRRPSGDTIFSITCITCASSRNRTSVSTSLPLRSTYTWLGLLTMTSVTLSSFSRGWMGPNPITSSTTSETMRLRSNRGTGTGSSSMVRSAIRLTASSSCRCSISVAPSSSTTRLWILLFSVRNGSFRGATAALGRSPVFVAGGVSLFFWLSSRSSNAMSVPSDKTLSRPTSCWTQPGKSSHSL